MTFATAPSSWSGGRWPRARTGSFLRRRWQVVAEPGIRTSRAPARAACGKELPGLSAVGAWLHTTAWNWAWWYLSC